LGPLVRQRLARTRQETLATLVRLGMQRIVIDGGRINASMRFHIDTRSAAQADEGSTFDFRNQVDAQGGLRFGPWGVKARMRNNIGYVSTSQTQTTEEMNVDLDLNSSVEIIFRTDQVPLNRLANADQTSRILATTRNPKDEAQIYAEERRRRRESQRQSDETRRTRTREAVTPRTAPAAGDRAAPRRPGQPPTGQQPAPRRPGQPPTGQQPAPRRPGQPPAGQQPAPRRPGQPPAGGSPAASPPGQPPAGGSPAASPPGQTPAGQGPAARPPAPSGAPPARRGPRAVT
ncbi:MAG: hypothetical protein R3293_26910, partial [Candidatus Promineifilaceae bacterium]|nr:hypothetical protein [Candidatus Promineifilaceae bacterium]